MTPSNLEDFAQLLYVHNGADAGRAISARNRSRHVVLSHMDRNPDPAIHKEAAQAAAFLEYDGPGRMKYFPESTLLQLMSDNPGGRL